MFLVPSSWSCSMVDGLKANDEVDSLVRDEEGKEGAIFPFLSTMSPLIDENGNNLSASWITIYNISMHLHLQDENQYGLRLRSTQWAASSPGSVASSPHLKL